MRVDRDDIPLLIQCLRYHYGEAAFKFVLFNGLRGTMSVDLACQSVHLTQRIPSRMQFLEAQNNIEIHILENWEDINLRAFTKEERPKPPQRPPTRYIRESGIG